MRFEVFTPCDILKPYVKHFAISEELDERTYKILPGTSIVLGFQYKGKLSRVIDNKTLNLATAGITGLQDTYNIFSNAGDTGTVLVFFKETGAAAFFKSPMNELFAENMALDNLIKSSLIDSIEERLAEAKTDSERIKIVERFLIAHMTCSGEDKLVLAAFEQIVKLKGIVRIADLAKQLFTSQGPLEKRFRKVVGTTPKKFASIVRLRAVLNNENKDDSLTRLGYAAGYFDQAHFIKDFKSFTGETPEQFFIKKKDE